MALHLLSKIAYIIFGSGKSDARHNARLNKNIRPSTIQNKNNYSDNGFNNKLIPASFFTSTTITAIKSDSLNGNSSLFKDSESHSLSNSESKRNYAKLREKSSFTPISGLNSLSAKYNVKAINYYDKFPENILPSFSGNDKGKNIDEDHSNNSFFSAKSVNHASSDDKFTCQGQGLVKHPLVYLRLKPGKYFVFCPYCHSIFPSNIA